MAEERSNFVRREDSPDGHSVKWDLSVGDLLHLLKRPFKKTYKTDCKKSPTSWRFEMWLPELGDDGFCSLSVLLERTDSLTDVETEACVWIDICDPQKRLIFKKQTFTRSGMLPGDTKQETVEMTALPDRVAAMRQNATVYFTLTISYCHSD